MLLNKVWLCACVGVILAGCSKAPIIKYTCPYGVGYFTADDYKVLADPNLISDQFADWLLKTNIYCEANK